MNKGQDVRIDLFKSNGDPKESSKQGRRCARVSIFGCYKVHFWDERHRLLPFPSSLGVSSVILLAINYAVFSPSSSGLSSFLSLSLFLYLLSSLQNLPRPKYPSKRSRPGLPDDVSPKIFTGMSSQLTYLPLSAFGR